MEQQCLAIPSVPVQQWDRTYGLEEALAEGTIFPELNKPFFQAPEGSSGALSLSGDPGLAFAQVCFAMDDALLYLDTHPGDSRAREYYQECLRKKNELLGQAGRGCADPYEWNAYPWCQEGGIC